MGYNGTPNNYDDKDFPWHDDKKHFYVCHAEFNAIINKYTANLKNCTLYTTLAPCNQCAKIIVQNGLKKVYYLSDKFRHKPEFFEGKVLLLGNKADEQVDFVQFEFDKDKVEIDFEEFLKDDKKQK